VRKRVAFALGLLALGGVAAAYSSETDTRVDEVRLAVFQQQIRFWLDDHAREGKTVVCLAIEDDGVRRSVTKDYLKRIPQEVAVRTGDDCEQRASGAVERATGRPAVLLVAGRVEWKSPDEAWVTIRHYRTAVVSGVRTQRVVREETRWVCLGQIIKDMPL